jgi:hypothetical protein
MHLLISVEKIYSCIQKNLHKIKNCCVTVFSTLESNYDIHFPGIHARYNYITPWPYRSVISFLVDTYKFNHEVI